MYVKQVLRHALVIYECVLDYVECVCDYVLAALCVKGDGQ